MENLIHKIIIGGLAGNASILIVYPLDFLRTRLGVDVGKKGESQFNNISDCIKQIYRSNGIRGFYQGLGMTMASTFIYRGLTFGLFDFGKLYIDDYQNRSFAFKYLFAQLVSGSTETFIYPTDTVRRRMMMNSGLEIKLYRNSFHCISEVFKNEGIIGFYKGCFSNLIRSTSSSLVLVLYDEMQNHWLKYK